VALSLASKGNHVIVPEGNVDYLNRSARLRTELAARCEHSRANCLASARRKIGGVVRAHANLSADCWRGRISDPAEPNLLRTNPLLYARHPPGQFLDPLQGPADRRSVHRPLIR
jgi:hypothetical protein